MANKRSTLVVALLLLLIQQLYCFDPDSNSNFGGEFSGGGQYSVDRDEYLYILKERYLPKERFCDIFIQKSVLVEAEKIVDTLKNYERYSGLGAKIPNLITIQGARGCGKKLLAKAIAGEAGAFLFFIDSLPDIDLCEELLESRPLIILEHKESSFDHIDKPSPLFYHNSWGSSEDEADDDKRKVISDLIKKQNGLQHANPVILMRTQQLFSSRRRMFWDDHSDDYEIFNLSSGLILERVIYIPHPDKDSRQKILKKFIDSVTTLDDLDEEKLTSDLAEKTNNFAALHLKKLINKAAICAARDFSMNKCEQYGVAKSHFDEAYLVMSQKVQSGTGGGSFFVEPFYYTYAEETRFSDVKGLDHVLVEVKEYIDIMQNRERYEKIGVKSPKGLLLEGLPGTGKTLIARAIAGEAGCCFICASGAQFINGWLGGGPESIRELFDFARQISNDKPVIIFIDEFDSLGKRPDSTDPISNEYSNTINELLRQMDGFRQDEKIIVVAATNNSEKLDSAILRQGRFDRNVYVPLPSVEGRKDILLYYMSFVSCDGSMDKECVAKELAKTTEGFSGASLKGLVNEAAILAIRSQAEAVKREHFFEAYKKLSIYAQQGVGGGGEGFTYAFSEEKRFSDVIGVEEVLSEVQSFIDVLKNPEKYKLMGSRVQKGLFLYGEPGTGKTLLARAIAGEAGCCFISVAASQFVKLYVGSGPLAIRRLFGFARKMSRNKKVIIFIDELDAFGKRTASLNGGREYNNTINELLTKIDGFAQDENIAIVGATNNVDLIDEALLREGRFDIKIKIPLPRLESRQKIFKYYLEKVKLDPELSLEKISKIWAKQTRGYSGAAIESLINRASLLAVRDGSVFLKEKHLEESFVKGELGLENKEKQTEKELENTAYHEAGHALLSVLCGNETSRISILSRENSLGAMFQIDEHEIFSNNFKTDLLKKAMIFVGGFCAERLRYGQVTPGAREDLSHANRLVSDMVSLYGMGNGELAGITSQFMKSELMKEKFDQGIIGFFKKIILVADRLLRKNMSKLNRLAKILLEKETLLEDEIYKITGRPNDVATSLFR
jgi:cell division protease FtsH